MNLERDKAVRQTGGLDETFEPSRSEDSKLAIASLVAQAKRSIFIVSRDLQPRVYDDADLVSSIKEFCSPADDPKFGLLSGTLPELYAGGIDWWICRSDCRAISPFVRRPRSI